MEITTCTKIIMPTSSSKDIDAYRSKVFAMATPGRKPTQNLVKTHKLEMEAKEYQQKNLLHMS